MNPTCSSGGGGTGRQGEDGGLREWWCQGLACLSSPNRCPHTLPSHPPTCLALYMPAMTWATGSW